jgi:hypothetical protein
MSTNVGSIHYDLSLDTSKFDKASAGLGSKMSSIGSGMTDIGKKMTLGVTLPVVAGFAFAVKAASDLNETINKVDVAFGKNAKEVKDWSKNSINSMGLAQQSALDATALFGDMATSMGLSTAEASKMSMGLTQLGADLASFKNISFSEAQTALAGVFTGETESLKRLGIVMTETNLLEYARSKGITKTVQEMTQAEKVQLRYNFVMDKTKNAQGDFIRTSGGTANQLRITQERFKQLSAEIGANFLPIANKILGVIQKIIAKFQALTPKQQNMILMFLGIAAVVGPLLVVFGSLIQAIAAIAGVIAGMSLTLGLVIVGVVAVIAGLVLLELKFKFVSRTIETLKLGIMAMIAAFKDGDRTSDGFVGVMERVGITLRNIWSLITTYVLPAFRLVWSMIAGSLIGAWNSLKDSFERVKTSLAPFMPQLMQLAQIILYISVGIIVAFVAAILGMVWVISVVIQAVATLINWVIRAGNQIHWIASVAWGAMSSFYSAVAHYLGAAIGIFYSIPGRIHGALGNLGGLLYGIGISIIQGLINGVSAMVGYLMRVVNSIADVVRSAFARALKIQSPSKIFFGFGENITKGLALGIDKGSSAVLNTIDNMTGAMQMTVKPVAGELPNSQAVSNVQETNINGNIMLGDSGAVDNFFNRLNRNGELARKGMTTL